VNLLNDRTSNGIDTLAAYLAGALETIEHLEEEMKDVLTRMQSLQSENSGLKERVAQLERRPEPRHEPRRIAVGEYLGLEVRVLNEERGISEILFANGNRTHVESSLVKRGGGSLLHQRSAG
jgi:regulator of replication initiation timing